MSELATIRSTRRGAEATRAAILEAAVAHFARVGFDTATLRDIAGEAGADVALIKRYFGGKDGLFLAALEASFGRAAPFDQDRVSFPREMAEMMAGDAHAHPERTERFRFLLRAATSPSTLPMLRAAFNARFLAPIQDWLGGADSEPRARALVATFVGFLVERLIRDAPLRGRDREVFMARVTATFETLLAEPDPPRQVSKDLG